LQKSRVVATALCRRDLGSLCCRGSRAGCNLGTQQATRLPPQFWSGLLAEIIDPGYNGFTGAEWGEAVEPVVAWG
jgi:hypothetical protein